MRKTTALLAIVALAAAASCLAQNAAPQGGSSVPVEILCRGGKPIAIRLIMSEPGLFTLQLPPDLCAPRVDQPPAAAPARPPASTPRQEV